MLVALLNNDNQTQKQVVVHSVVMEQFPGTKGKGPFNF